jgi:hypothetical protein
MCTGEARPVKLAQCSCSRSTLQTIGLRAFKQEITSVRFIRYSALLLSLLVINLKVATAQSADAYFGLGTAMDSASGVPSDTFGNGTLYYPPKMGGLFGTVGGGFMITPHFGFGAETSFRMSRGSYAGLTYRPTFYDFNGIYHPVSATKRIVPEFQAGLGGVNLKFYVTSNTAMLLQDAPVRTAISKAQTICKSISLPVFVCI